MKFVGFLVSLLLAYTANASVLTLTPGDQQISGVNVATSAVANIAGTDVTLTNVGAGLRKKYIAILGTSVYVAQVFAAQPEQYVKSNLDMQALDSLKDQTAVAVKLDFVFNVSADKVYNAFEDALKANEVDLASTAIVEFLSYVQNGGDANKGTSMTFVMSKNADGSEVLVYEDPAGAIKTVNGTQGFSQQILSMWLGKISSSDKGLKELKDQLTK